MLSFASLGNSPAPGYGKRKPLSNTYYDGFNTWLRTGGSGMDISASLTEGFLPGGGYAVPMRVYGSVTTLGPMDSAVRRLATVIETTTDIKFPTEATASTAAARPEGSVFGGTSPLLGTFTLSAFATGVEQTISFEAGQDVEGLQAFLVQDSAFAVDNYEEGKFLSGSGINEPQGMLGNVGAGVTGATADSAGNLLSVNATYDVLDTLKDVYHSGASWLMTRATGSASRKAARANNDPVWTRVGGQDFLHGYPVEYSASMPAIAPGSTPVLFGNFKLGYLVGDRGSSDVYVKLLDQVLAAQGLYQLLVYRRTDGRVFRSEAIQGITLHA